MAGKLTPGPDTAAIVGMNFPRCASVGCTHDRMDGHVHCSVCIRQALERHKPPPAIERSPGRRHTDNERTMSQKYPKYYKPIPKGMTELDFYAVAQIFGVNDAAISHALKKLMLPGVRTGKKTHWDDIKEARDTLSRWLELNEPQLLEDPGIDFKVKY